MTDTTWAAEHVPDASGLLRLADFITAEAERGHAIDFRTTLVLDSPAEQVVEARVYATAHGVYEITVDGQQVTGSVLNPGWTAYEWRLQYQSFDITGLLRSSGGEVAVRLRVGNGWYRGDLGFEGANANYGTQIGILAAIEVEYTDGHRQMLTTSPSWSATTCEVTRNSIYHGQDIDARLIAQGKPLAVAVGEFDAATLVPQVGPLIRRQEVLPPVQVWQSPSGKTLVDFGQNLVGWLRVRVTGPRGAAITFRHAEVLEDGELGTRPLRLAKATDVFILSGGDDTFEPTFTFHGFRYAEVTGWPGEFDPSRVEAVVVHSDMPAISEFECSNPLVNQLVHNSVWGQKGNFLSVPTDCPQRDERLGWTGDIAVYAPTAAFQFDVADFLHSWLLDLAAELSHRPEGHGYVPLVVPDILKLGDYSGAKMSPMNVAAFAIWADSAVWVPMALWDEYGDLDRLSAQYPGMVAHVESIEPLLSDTGLWDEGFQLADWLDPDAPTDQPWVSKADPGVVATAAFYRSVAFLARAARLLGQAEDSLRWASLANRLRTAFRAHYIADQRVKSDCATVYAIAIRFGLLEPDELAWAGDRLAELVAERDYIVTTGFTGTPFVTWALSETGHADDAYRLLLQTKCPSWCYAVTMGATTIWERWDSMLPDGSINPGEMTSFNHYALGAVADWVYKAVAGIRPAAPGYQRILIQPTPGPGIEWVKASHDTRVGRIAASWNAGGGIFSIDLDLPVAGEVILPDGSRAEASPGRHRFTCPWPPQDVG